MTKRPPRPAWPQRAIDECMRLIADGVSRSKAAKILNEKYDLSLTANAVAGVVWRRKGAPPPEVRASRLKKGNGKAMCAPKTTPLIIPADKAPDKVMARALRATVKIDGLGPGVCHYPIGEPKFETFGYCGRQSDGSYCQAHRRLMYDVERTVKLKGPSLAPPRAFALPAVRERRRA